MQRERVGVAALLYVCTLRGACPLILQQDPWARAPSVILSCTLTQESGSPGLGERKEEEENPHCSLPGIFLVDSDMLIFLHLFYTIKAPYEGLKVSIKDKHLSFLEDIFSGGKTFSLHFVQH